MKKLLDTISHSSKSLEVTVEFKVFSCKVQNLMNAKDSYF